MKKSLQSRGKQLFRYFLAAIALFWLVSQGQWQESLNTLAGVSAYTLILLFIFAVGGLLFRFLRWYAFIRLEKPVQFRTAAEVDLIINFINQLFPSRLSGTAAAPLVITQHTGIKMGTSIGITGIFTACYAIIYGIVSGFGVIFLIQHSSISILGIVGLSTLLYLILGLILLISGLKATMVDSLLKRLVPLVEQIPAVGTIAVAAFDRIPDFTDQSKAVFEKTLNSPLTICLYVVGWVGSVALFPALRVGIMFGAFGTQFAPLVMLPVILITAYSVTLLPLTPGGIGVTEATAAAVFVSLGVPYEAAAATILVDRVLGVYLPSLLGWYPMVRNPLTLETG
jgi:uncharacterized protein (TIRG00374 family)